MCICWWMNWVSMANVSAFTKSRLRGWTVRVSNLVKRSRFVSSPTRQEGLQAPLRGVLPTVVRRCMWSRNLVNEEALAHWWAVEPNGGKKKIVIAEQIKKFRIMQSPPLPCYPLLLTPKYVPQCPILEHPHPMFFHSCDRPSFYP